jgi:uncharacterized protein (TIGR02118 family)
MKSAGLPVVSCVFAPALDTPAHIELAERLGYRRAWCYDSPAMYADPWMILALAAARTRAIGLGPAWASDLLDPASVACLTVEEHVVKSEPVPASFVKNYEFVMKRPDMARDEFDRYWAQVHGPLAATVPTIRRYVQAHLSPGTRDAGTAPLDGLAITWFDDVAAMRAGAVTEAYARTRADERNFLAGELPFVVTTERPTFPCPDLGVAE